MKKKTRNWGNNSVAFLIKQYKNTLASHRQTHKGLILCVYGYLLYKKQMLMKVMQDENGNREIVFLSQNDKDFLIYMNTDIWITPELKRFKNELLERAGEKPGNQYR